jgi:excisionase family DNA binding protein
VGELIRLRFAGTGPSEVWLSKRQLADGLSVSTRTVDRWIQQGLPVGRAWRQVGGRRRFLRSEVLLWLDERV